jgi:phosphohistidine phosphatase SixA
MNKPKHTVILMRHGSRDTYSPGDSPLNTTGLAQAEVLAKLVRSGLFPTPSRLIVSPKKRAKQTLSPLAAFLGFDPTVDPRLDERNSDEALQDFESRVRSFLDDVARAPNSRHPEPPVAKLAATAPATLAPAMASASLTIACSHLDWLESAMVLAPSDMSESELTEPWSPGAYRIFEIVDGVWKHTKSGVISAL